MWPNFLFVEVLKYFEMRSKLRKGNVIKHYGKVHLFVHHYTCKMLHGTHTYITQTTFGYNANNNHFIVLCDLFGLCVKQ